MYELTKRLEGALHRPDIQTMLDLAAEVVYSQPDMTSPDKVTEAAEKIFIMLEFGLRRQDDMGLPVDKSYFESLHKNLDFLGWTIYI